MPRLTDAVIKNAVPPAKDWVEIKCSDHRGLRIRVFATGARSFVFRYKKPSDGKDAVMTIGKYGPNETTLKDAHAAYTAARDALDAGRDPSARRGPQSNPDDSLAAAIAIYERDHVSTMRPGVAAYVKAELDDFQTGTGGIALKAVTRAHVVEAIARRRKAGDSAAVQCWKVVRGFLAWCEGSLATEYTSPAHKIKRPAKEVSRDRVLEDDELKTVWKRANAATTNAQFGALLKLLILTGCRRNEIADLQWSEVNGVAFTIPGARTKNKKAHSVALTPMVKDVLASLPREKDAKFVLRRPGYPDKGFSGFSKAKATLGDGLDDWRLHDLRRSFATGLQRLKVLPHVIERCINHLPGGVEGTYQRDPLWSEKREAFEKWSAHVKSLMAEKRAIAA
jgi:integrase